jgi:hypothetical protein
VPAEQVLLDGHVQVELTVLHQPHYVPGGDRLPDGERPKNRVGGQGNVLHATGLAVSRRPDDLTIHNERHGRARHAGVLQPVRHQLLRRLATSLTTSAIGLAAGVGVTLPGACEVQPAARRTDSKASSMRRWKMGCHAFSSRLAAPARAGRR